jgi:hypothetical protein
MREIAAERTLILNWAMHSPVTVNGGGRDSRGEINETGIMKSSAYLIPVGFAPLALGCSF